MDSSKYMNPMSDIAFKRIFGRTENKSLLIDFLNSLLVGERHIKDVQYMDKEQVPEEDSRSIIYDIFCETDTGEKIIVEMQNCNQPNFAKRMIYYAANAVARQGQRGDEWKYDIKAVYCIAFMNFTESSLERKVLTNVGLCDRDNGKHFLDTLRFVFIQLPLFTKTEDECESFFDKWLYVLKNMDVLERLPKEFQCEAFRKLKEVSDVSKLSDDERRRYERTLRNYRDALNVVEGARAEGMEKGLAKGREEGARSRNIAIALNLKAMKLPAEDISRATGLSIEEIEKL
jgi:predicted transposase/invertase (TIGR01784 family)